MTDITIHSPAVIRRFRLPAPNMPSLSLGVSLEAIVRLMGDAFNLAYVDPYTSRRKLPSTTDDEDLEGRDPNW